MNYFIFFMDFCFREDFPPLIFAGLSVHGLHFTVHALSRKGAWLCFELQCARCRPFSGEIQKGTGGRRRDRNVINCRKLSQFVMIIYDEFYDDL